jgi:aminoglycoside phosphotransferase (APT) family kinase protein
MHDGQLAVSSGMVRTLVDEQFPGWRELAITKVDAAGTVNAIFRIGGSRGT